MGMSTDGEIHYGIKFDEDFVFPWNTDEFEYDIEEWWQEVGGFQPLFQLYDADGDMSVENAQTNN